MRCVGGQIRYARTWTARFVLSISGARRSIPSGRIPKGYARSPQTTEQP
jgi:hypothetical protein